MKVSDILQGVYPYTNTRGITHIMPKYAIISTINDAIQFIYNYKGYIWTWQIKTLTYNINYDENGNVATDGVSMEIVKNKYIYTIKTPTPIIGFNSVYVDGQLFKAERDLTGLFARGNFVYKFLDTEFKIMTDKKINEINFVYIKGHNKVYEESDEIDLPDSFYSVVRFFVLEFLTPVYPTVDQGMDRKYQQIAVDMIESMKLQDSNVGNRIKVTI